MRKTALIIGITGQDGSYLAHYLLSLGYRVVGTTRDLYNCDLSRLTLLSIKDDLELQQLNPLDFRSVVNIFKSVQPEEVYNLSGLSSVGLSFQFPVECLDSIISVTSTLLEAIKFFDNNIKLFTAGSSECFGNLPNNPANEKTLFNPVSPYAVAKSSSYWLVKTYRHSYNLYCCTGILSNHESPLRPEKFVTQKILCSANKIKKNQINSIKLGNIDVYRDWGWAPDYVKAMHLMLQQSIAKDYIIATGSSSSLRQFAEAIFSHFNLNFDEYLVQNEDNIRPSEIHFTKLDPSLILNDLGWKSNHDLYSITSNLVENNLF